MIKVWQNGTALLPALDDDQEIGVVYSQPLLVLNGHEEPLHHLPPVLNKISRANPY